MGTRTIAPKKNWFGLGLLLELGFGGGAVFLGGNCPITDFMETY